MISSLPLQRFGLPLAGKSTGAAGTAAAPGSTPPDPLDSVVTGVLPEGVSPSAAMDILQKARASAELERIQQGVTAAQARLAQAEATTVNPQDYVGKAMSAYGIWAMCMPPLGAMLILPHMGLTGVGAIVGMVGGMLVAPALALWGVRKSGESDAKQQEAVVEEQKARCRSEVQRLEQAAEGALRASMLRLWKEQQALQEARAADPNGCVTATDTTVKIGNVVVSRRLEQAQDPSSAR